MSLSVKRVVVSGGAGQIAYSALFRIAQGDLLGKDQPLALHILEIPEALGALKGVAMELEDCAFPLLREVHIGSDPREIFEGADYVFLIGSKPRGPGMERKDLLGENAKIFIEQGKALNEVVSEDVLVLVVGNPANTNCLIALHHAPRIPPSRFYSMMRLDQNRATSFLAGKAGVLPQEVQRVVVWGNHSAMQVPDFTHATIRGRPLLEVIPDRRWLEEEFFPKVQKRGAAVIEARGKSSAASAAHAAIEAMRSLLYPTPEGEVFSTGIYSKGNPYGIEEDLVFSFPCRSRGKGVVEIVGGWEWEEFLQKKIALCHKELCDERQLVAHLL